LKIYHLFSQGVKIHLLGSLVLWILADMIVLTVDASHVAIAKEDGSSSSGARNSWLLAVMVANCRDNGQVSRMAKPKFIS
jgi:pyridoxal biosynthesis lyase PdxS